jgi:hypothetical protein
LTGKNRTTPQGLPDSVIEMLSAADKRNNHPPGTMFALMQQETGGNQKYIDDPTTFHYPVDATGKRKSSAAGPFGILSGTAKDPGYGVKPLQDNSFAEHTRFASDYLKVRGAAAYGEGPAYAAQLQARIPGGQPVQRVVTTQATPAVVPVADPRIAPAEVPVVQATQVAQEPVPAAVVAQNPGAWQQWLDARQVVPNQVAAAPQPVPPQASSLQVPDFMAGLASQQQPQQAAFQMLKALKGWA